MRYEQPIPFYMAYPFLLPLDQEQAQEKDLQVMKSFYSRRAARIQEKADRECDRMEYDGSMMFDEYPDKFMMEHLCRKIEQEALADAVSSSMYDYLKTEESGYYDNISDGSAFTFYLLALKKDGDTARNIGEQFAQRCGINNEEYSDMGANFFIKAQELFSKIIDETEFINE